MFKIESNIPVPSRGNSATKSELLAVAKKIKVGESIYFDDNKEASRFYSTLNRLGRKAIRRKEGKGVRVWRAYGKPNWVKANEEIAARKES